MRNVVALCFVLLLAGPQARAWMTDLKVAQDRAYAENRVVLINFTGSDWCGWCIKLRKEVFETPEFNAFAERHLMLVEVDFPNNTPISAAQRAVNKGLAERYGIQGYPTIVLLNSKGNEVGRLGYLQGGPKAYINAIRERTGLPGSESGYKPDPAAPPTFGGAKVGPPPKYASLTLKRISGSGSKRLALINNQTLAVGESGKVRLGDGEVKVRVDEIRDKSVVVTVEGKPGRKELSLSDL
ncbi:MAG TPA: thioredoxin family protein [Verrucomicrobiae bacterium]|nr:thioredoxin family protein [Verrucomicrobiae bacterium]